MNLKYGLLFVTLGVAIVMLACVRGGWSWFALWPGVSFVLVGIAYLAAGVAIYGKRKDGVIPFFRFIVLAPFLIHTWLVWRVLRQFSREPAYHELTPGVLIGRRLLPHDLPAVVDCIVDVTSEFNEAPAIRRMPGYMCIPILDADVPPLESVVAKLRDIQSCGAKRIYIHWRKDMVERRCSQRRFCCCAATCSTSIYRSPPYRKFGL